MARKSERRYEEGHYNENYTAHSLAGDEQQQRQQHQYHAGDQANREAMQERNSTKADSRAKSSQNGTASILSISMAHLRFV